MAKFHYWTTINSADDDESFMDTSHSLIDLTPATRLNTDTLLRFVVWTKLVATVGPTSVPTADWLAGATVDWLFYFDAEQVGNEVHIDDNNPNTVGFVRLTQSVWTSTTTSKYSAMFQGPPEGLDVHATRKGDGAGPLPALSAQRWVSDNAGVFDNFGSFGILLSSRLIGRALWASDDPGP